RQSSHEPCPADHRPPTFLEKFGTCLSRNSSQLCRRTRRRQAPRRKIFNEFPASIAQMLAALHLVHTDKRKFSFLGVFLLATTLPTRKTLRPLNHMPAFEGTAVRSVRNRHAFSWSPATL